MFSKFKSHPKIDGAGFVVSKSTNSSILLSPEVDSKAKIKEKINK